MNDLINCHVMGFNKLAINKPVCSQTLSFVEFFFFFFVIQNVIDKIDKETLRIGFRINHTFLSKKITKKVFTKG